SCATLVSAVANLANLITDKCIFICKKNFFHLIVFINIYIYKTFFYITRFVGMIEFYHTIPFLMDIIGLVLAMSLTLTQMITTTNDMERIIKSINVTVLTLHLFVFNYMGQKVTDASSNACEKVYNSVWYSASASEQKLLLLIMKRRFHPLILTACRFYVMSLQNFGMILQTAISYCMFMRQL
ncbi:OR4 protein, partial [Acromyrmex charruanus]